MGNLPNLSAPEPVAPALSGIGASGAPAREREDELFRREVERAAERNGGRERVEQRLAAERALRREERRAGFAEHREERSEAARRPARERRTESAEPAVEAPAPARTTPAALAPNAGATPEHAQSAPLASPTAAHTGASKTSAALASTPASAALASNAPATPGVNANGALLSSPATPVGAASSAPKIAGLPAAGGTTAPAAETGPKLQAQRPAPAPPPEPDPEPAAELLRQIRLHFADGAGGTREALLHLSPPELGRMLVRLSIKNGRVGALVRGESAEALALFERHLPELRAALGGQGVEVAELKLELGFERRSGGRSGELASGERGSAGLPANDLRASRVALPPPLSTAALALGVALERGVDTYA